MKTKMNWKNPYARGGKLWLKGNLHMHSTGSDGELVPQQIVKVYERMGYDFLSITDHNLISSGNEAKTSLVMLPGAEMGPRHMCIISRDPADIVVKDDETQQERISRNIEKGNIVILNHPDWQSREHYTIDELISFTGYTGIEIYNFVIERLAGSPLSTAKWDRLLGKGIRLLGFANQDAHKSTDIQDCCNVVRTNRRTRVSVFQALMTGNFYCYCGVTITDIGRQRNTVYVKTRNADLIRFVGNNGVILGKVKGKKAEWHFKSADPNEYIRVECLGSGEAISWSQPFFR